MINVVKNIKLSLIALIALFLIGCDDASEEKQTKGRFDVLETFYMFDGDNASGKLLKDRVTGSCYLYHWGGMDHHGGPAMVETSCSAKSQLPLPE